MIAKAQLLIYAEEDFLFPLIIDGGGRLCRYSAPDGTVTRLWLYFNVSTSGINYGKIFKSKALAGLEDYCCGLWNALENGRKISVERSEYGFFELLRRSSMISDLKKFWADSTGLQEPVIPVHYLFADSISSDARKKFMEEMQTLDFECCSFSVNPAAPLCSYILRTAPSFKPVFGDNVLIMNAVSEALRFSSPVYDGEQFLSDGQSRRVEGFGDSPLKTALVKYIVDTVDSGTGYLTTPEKRDAEYLFQLSNADKWFSLSRKRAGDFDIEDFRYSFAQDRSIPYTCTVKAHFLETEQENAVRGALAQIKSYINDTLGKNPSFIIFCGETFEEDDFTPKILSRLEIKNYIILTPTLLADALFEFFRICPDMNESLGEFNVIASRVKKENAGVSDWVSYAGKINRMEDDLKDTGRFLEEAVRADRRQVEEMLSVCDGYLKRSKFADARATLQRYAIPSASVSSCISDAEAVLRNSVGMTPVYERVEPVGRAKEKISSIRRLEDEVRALEAEADRNASELSEKLAKVDDYEAKYPEYKKLRREFDLAGTLREKRELRLKLLDYTMEELPELELEHVRATIDAELEKRGGFFKKKSVLKFTVTIEKNRELPCDAELHIATRALTSAEDRMCYIYEIPKGTEGRVSGEVELPQRYIEPKKTINLYLFPAEDVLDKKAVTADFKYIKQ